MDEATVGFDTGGAFTYLCLGSWSVDNRKLYEDPTSLYEILTLGLTLELTVVRPVGIAGNWAKTGEDMLGSKRARTRDFIFSRI
jgi:hypothetical protein